MKLSLCKLMLLQLLVFSCGKPQPIQAVFLKAFSGETGIQVCKKMAYEMEVNLIDPLFTEEQKNRKHYDDRPSHAQVDYLVMHYTHSNLARTIETFTSNTSENRVSAHYVIAEKEEISQIQGGEVIQVVPEEKRAWHAGTSFWKGVQNLNPYSIGIENVNKGFTRQYGVLGGT